MNKIEQKYIEIDKLMERFNADPDGLLEYAEAHLPKYLFYSQKKKHAYCTACKQTFKPFKGLRHNEPNVCPICGAEVIAKSEGRISKLTDVVWTMWAQNDGDDICTHYYRTVADYSEDFEDANVETTEEFRNIHDSEFHDYMWWHTNAVGYSSRERWLPYARRGGYYYYSYTGEYYEPRDVYVYGDLMKTLSLSRFKYCPIDGLLKAYGTEDSGAVNAFIVDGWLNTYKRIPQIELICKVGFLRLTYAVRREQIQLNKEATNVRDALGVTRKQFKTLLELGDPSVEEFNAVKKYTCTADEARWLAALGSANGSEEKLAELERLAPLGKLRPYLASIGNDVNSYSDYMTWIIALGYNHKDKGLMFPKEFWKAHDKIMEQFYFEQDKVKNEAIRAVAEKFPCELHCGGMFVRPAMSAAELRKEGTALHHCVATYAGRMAEGRSIILFVRKESEPDAPFYTMEVVNWRIIQLRGLRNCAPTPDVAEFRAKFEEVLKKAEKKAKRTRKAA